jgi:hypothetical protein
VDKVRELGLAPNIIALGSVAARAKRLEIPVHRWAAEAVRNNVVRSRVPVANFSAMLALPLVTFEHDLAVHWFVGIEKFLSASAAPVDCVVVASQPVEADLALRRARNCVTFEMNSAFARCFVFLEAALGVVQTFLARRPSRNCVALVMAIALARCFEFLEAALGVVRAFLARSLALDDHLKAGPRAMGQQYWADKKLVTGTRSFG